MGFSTALIVDDSKLARIALKRKLEQRGLQIVMAEDAKQALELLQSNSIDIVFMDHLMPEMDGFEATREIKSNTATAHLPVIMCSGKEKQGYLEEARAIGASNVLPKPAESNAIDAVFAELEQEESGEHAAELLEAGASVSTELGEAEVFALMQPVTNRLEALVEQFDALAKHTDERFVTVADTIQAWSERDSSKASVDTDSLQAAWDAKLEQRINGLALPDAEAMKVQLEESLGSSLQRQVESKLTEVATALEQFRAEAGQMGAELKARFEQWQADAEAQVEKLAELSKQRDEEMARVSEQNAQALRTDIEQRVAALAGAAVVPDWDLDGLRSSLKAELAEELKVGLGESAATVDAKDMGENIKSEVLEQLRAEMPAAAPAAELDLDALRESLRTELLAQVQAGDPANMAQFAEDSQAQCSNEESNAPEGVDDDIDGVDRAVVTQARQLKHELKALKMLGLISAIVAATSIALHWL